MVNPMMTNVYQAAGGGGVMPRGRPGGGFDDAQVVSGNVHDVVLLNGFTQTPSVCKTMQECFDCKEAGTSTNDEVVAARAAVHGWRDIFAGTGYVVVGRHSVARSHGASVVSAEANRSRTAITNFWQCKGGEDEREQVKEEARRREDREEEKERQGNEGEKEERVEAGEEEKEREREEERRGERAKRTEEGEKIRVEQSDGRKFRTIQIFAKVDGSDAFPLEVSLSDKVGDVVKGFRAARVTANVTCTCRVKEE